MDELLRPIDGEGLDIETLKRLYESKLVYLENLRIRCFVEMNQEKPGLFKLSDYNIVLVAISRTTKHLQDLVVLAVTSGLAKRKVS
jgi:hypothetical protein